MEAKIKSSISVPYWIWHGDLRYVGKRVKMSRFEGFLEKWQVFSSYAATIMVLLLMSPVLLSMMIYYYFKGWKE